MEHIYAPKFVNDVETFDEAAIWAPGIAEEMNKLRKRLVKVEKAYLRDAGGDAFLAVRRALDRVFDLQFLLEANSEQEAVDKLGVTRKQWRAYHREFMDTRRAVGRLLRTAQIREQGYVKPYEHAERDCDNNGVPIIITSARERLERNAAMKSKRRKSTAA